MKRIHLSLTTGRIAIEGALRDVEGDEHGSSNIFPLRVEESSVYFDLFSLEEGLPPSQDRLAVVFLGTIA